MADRELSPQERRHERARELIRSAAVRLFREKGYDRTSVAEIADAADISERTLFRYFRAKEDVLFGRPEALIPIGQQLIVGLEDDMSDWEVLKVALRTFGAFMQANEEDVRPAVELIHAVADLHARRMLMQERWALAMAASLAQRRGQEEPSFDDVAIAGAAFAIYGAAVQRWLAESDRTLSELVDETFSRFDSARDGSPRSMPLAASDRAQSGKGPPERD